MKTKQQIFLGVLLLFFVACAGQKSDKSTQTITIKKQKSIMIDTNKVTKTEDEWQKKLTPDQFYVLRQKGTERPFTGKFWNSNEKGEYHCAACGNYLFSSQTKFDAGCGWPSFSEAAAEKNIISKADSSHGMMRTEVMCAKCGGHLGHVFDDGPKPAGLRYCINSESLTFEKK